MTTLEIETLRVFRPLLQPSRYKGAYGGRGSAKSHFFAESAIERCLMRHGSRGVCIREVQKDLKESAKRLIEDKIEAMNVGSYFRCLRSEIITPGDGVILFQGMQDHTTESIKSLENFDWAWVEEAQTLSAKSLEMLRPTIRAPGSELWFSWNPRHASDPVDQFFRGATPPPDSICVRTSFRDNRFFPRELELERAHDEKHNPERYAHIWLGEYEPVAVGAIWDRLTLHQNRRSEAPDLERIVVAVDPAVSAEINSDEHGIVVVAKGADNRGYVLDDCTMKGSPRQWADRAIAAFDRYEADCIVIEVNQGGDMVRHTLEAARPGLPIHEVRASRGKHVRAEPISALYHLGRVSHIGSFPKLEDQMCQMTAAGYEGEGSPDRCLAAGTIVETIRGGVAIERVAAGDRVLTRSGFRRVLAAGRTRVAAPVIRVIMSDGSELTGTGNHPVFVDGKGFIRLDALVRGDILVTCVKRSSFSRVASMFATLIHRTVRPASISTTMLAARGLRAVARCIVTSGNTTTGRYLPGISSITRTKTRSTTSLTILNAVRMRSMQNATRRSTTKLWRAWTMPAFMRVLGMAVRKVAIFTVSLERRVGRLGGQSLVFAGSAGFNTKRFPVTGLRVSARAPVGIVGGRKTAPTTSNDSARLVESRSWPRDQKASDAARVSVVGLSDAGRADVFNLTVEGENEYFANGMLVHNCDALVWGFTELFPALVTPKVKRVEIEPLGRGGWMG